MILNNREYLEQLRKMTKESSVDWTVLTNKAVLVTGAAGMLGSGVVDELIYLNEYENIPVNIYALGRTEGKIADRFGEYVHKPYFHIIEADISYEVGTDERVDYIVHAASNANPVMFAKYPVDTLLANVLGTNNLLSYAKKVGAKRLLYVSSGEMYGQPDDTLDNGFYEGYCGKVDYTDARSCYPSGKRAAEVLCKSYISQYDMEAVIVRPCHCYGPTMTTTDSRAISQFIRKALNKEDIVLKSEGTLERTHCYVVDATQAMFLVLLNAPNGEAYNIADTASNASIKELANIIAESKNQKVVFDLPNDVEKQGFSRVVRAVLDGDKLLGLGWKPMWHLKDGIQSTVDILEE